MKLEFFKRSSADQGAIIREVAARRGGSAVMVEKDFWVSWTLAVLFAHPEFGEQLVFKGGTSLSKVFGVIERFSEDIDLSVSPEFVGIKEKWVDEAESRNKRTERMKELEAACIETVRKRFAPELERIAEESFGKPVGGKAWMEFQVDDDTHSPVMLFHYPSNEPTGFEYLRRSVKMEFGSLTDQRHILPAAAIPKQGRYRGTIEDERRLFYIALTRSQKFLHLTYAPVPGNRKFQRVSDFLTDVYRSKYVKRRPADYTARTHCEPEARKGVTNVVFTFSDIKYFFECPYQFKLRILYGFNAPIHEALGYGRSLHNALAEVHRRAMDGDFGTSADADDLKQRHLHAPYAYRALREKLEQAASRVLTDYINDNAAELKNIEFSEKQIEITLDDGVSIVGRIDLVRRIDTGETTIVDLKSSERAQQEEVTETQLHVYALGYRELTGRDADQVEIYELDERKRKSRSVDEEFVKDVKVKVEAAASALRSGTLIPDPEPKKCASCDYLKICTAGSQVASGMRSVD